MNAATEVPGYLIAKLTVRDAGDYMRRYAMPVLEQMKAHGGEVIANSRHPEIYEGQWEGNWTVIMRFPSVTQARDYLYSGGYAPLRDLRRAELTSDSTVVIVEGFDPALLSAAESSKHGTRDG